MKVLFVSDSLGTPIHPRGIFNFSMSLAELLKTLGATVDLIVEGEHRFGWFGQTDNEKNSPPPMEEVGEASVSSVRLAEVHRCFNQYVFKFRWNYRTPYIQRLFAIVRPFVAALLSFQDERGARPTVKVANDLHNIDFTPPRSEHLNVFDNFLVRAKFYSSTMSRANLGLPKPIVDGAGYDLIVVDTPHYITIKNILPNRILTVVHDLIPLRDPFMNASQRNLFMHKLVATLKLRGNMVYVSQFTQRSFHRAFPNHRAANEFVIHPAIRRKLMSEGERLRNRPQPFKLPALTIQIRPISDPVNEAADSSGNGKVSLLGGAYAPSSLDLALPYFVTATSDEPRKNIAAVVEAFYRRLRGRANVVILGEIDPRRYYPGPGANVYFPGYVSDAEKTAYFQGARGVVFASLSEGFGIPIVEGAVLGLPVLCSDIEVFREVAEDSALYFDPRDPLSLADAVEAALDDPQTAKAQADRLRKSVIARFSQAAVGATVSAALSTLGLPVKGH